LSDGLRWSGWSEPSKPCRVKVAPPGPLFPDTDTIVVEPCGSNVVLTWPALVAYGGLQQVEYAVFVKQILKGGEELCPRQTAALVCGQGVPPGSNVNKLDPMRVEIRDLRRDLDYVFTIAARYPVVGPRQFEEVFRSGTCRVAVHEAQMPIPVQVTVPESYAPRFAHSRAVIVRWPLARTPDGGVSHEEFEVQGRAEDAMEWVNCISQGTYVNGVHCVLLKDLPFYRGRFRLWSPSTGRVGVPSNVMVTLIEPPPTPSPNIQCGSTGVRAHLNIPLNAPHGTHDFVCRYQVAYKTAQLDSKWHYLPAQLFWHAHNSKQRERPMVETDEWGALESGLGGTTADLTDMGTNIPAMPLVDAVGTCASELGKVFRRGALSVEVGEEDGLSVGSAYCFAVRIGDLYRFSQWSPMSEALKIQVAPAIANSVVIVSEVTTSSCRLAWAPFVPAENCAAADLEYLVEVFSLDELKQAKVRAAIPCNSYVVKSSEDKSGSISMRATGLSPGTDYEVAVSCRYARVGTRNWTEGERVALRTQASEKADVIIDIKAAAHGLPAQRVSVPVESVQDGPVKVDMTLREQVRTPRRIRVPPLAPRPPWRKGDEDMFPPPPGSRERSRERSTTPKQMSRHTRGTLDPVSLGGPSPVPPPLDSGGPSWLKQGGGYGTPDPSERLEPMVPVEPRRVPYPPTAPSPRLVYPRRQLRN